MQRPYEGRSDMGTPSSAARFEEASQLLRELYEHLPYTGADTPEEHFWLSHASSLLHECANLMRNGMTAT